MELITIVAMVIIDFGYFFTSTAPVASALVSLACNTPTLSRSCSSWWTAECWHECWRSYTKIYIIEHTCIYIYIPGKPYGHFFCPLWVLPVTDVFFVQLRILVFDCEGLFKSFDNTVFGHPPTVSKRGISVQSGANWESWSGTQIWPQILPYFPPNLDVPIK